MSLRIPLVYLALLSASVPAPVNGQSAPALEPGLAVGILPGAKKVFARELPIGLPRTVETVLVSTDIDSIAEALQKHVNEGAGNAPGLGRPVLLVTRYEHFFQGNEIIGEEHKTLRGVLILCGSDVPVSGHAAVCYRDLMPTTNCAGGLMPPSVSQNLAKVILAKLDQARASHPTCRPVVP